MLCSAGSKHLATGFCAGLLGIPPVFERDRGIPAPGLSPARLDYFGITWDYSLRLKLEKRGKWQARAGSRPKGHQRAQQRPRFGWGELSLDGGSRRAISNHKKPDIRRDLAPRCGIIRDYRGIIARWVTRRDSWDYPRAARRDFFWDYAGFLLPGPADNPE